MPSILLPRRQVPPETVAVVARMWIRSRTDRGDDVARGSFRDERTGIASNDDPGASAFAPYVHSQCSEAVACPKYVARDGLSQERLGQHSYLLPELREERGRRVSSVGTLLGDRRSRAVGSVGPRACSHGGVQAGSKMRNKWGAMRQWPLA